MPDGVLCAVDTCTYWAENNKCTAANINIQTDFAALIRQDSEFASELGYVVPDVRHSIDTCCQTFERKEH